MSPCLPPGPLSRRGWLRRSVGTLAAGTPAGWAALGATGCTPAPAEPPLPPCRWVGPDPARGHRLRQPLAERLRGAAATPARRVGVLVVGGGVAGLSALRRLAEAGVDDAELLELHDTVGGNALGHRLQGLACPLGAHYLPVPGPAAGELRDWLAAIGLLRRDAGGRLRPDPAQLCHAPQERLFLDGAWQSGLLPDAEGRPATQAQYRRFAQRVAEAQALRAFAMPSVAARPDAAAGAMLRALDAQTFGQWLDAQGLDDAWLRAYLDYACRDDYGAGLDTVSAWAGLHYFASRHGFRAPGPAAPALADDDGEDEGSFTWPEGNARLVAALAAPLADRLQPGRVALALAPARRAGLPHTLWAWNVAADRPERWQAHTVVLAVPLAVAARLLAAAAQVGAAPADAGPAFGPALAVAAAAVPKAPWLVANLALDGPLMERPGVPPAWDNVAFAPAGQTTALGYVDATHQGFRPHPGPTVLTAYHALPLAWRGALLAGQAEDWGRFVRADLARLHADLPQAVRAIDLCRWGHAMAVPVPGLHHHPALAALREAATRPGARLRLAHTDLVGYSVFEEAFALGWRAGGRPA